MKSYSTTMFISLLTTDQQQENNFDHFPDLSTNQTESNTIDSTSTTTAADKNEKILVNEDENTRETWSNNLDYLITTLGGLIGLGK